MQDSMLTPYLKHLQGVIHDAEHEPNETSAGEAIQSLRGLIKLAAVSMPNNHVIRIAKTILQCGIEVDQAYRDERDGKT